MINVGVSNPTWDNTKGDPLTVDLTLGVLHVHFMYVSKIFHDTGNLFLMKELSFKKNKDLFIIYIHGFH